MVRVAVVRFPGSNCETESIRAVNRAGGEGFVLDYRATDLQGAEGVILPGGFSYGDYLRSGAIARFAPVMGAVQAHAERGGAVLGICNGFQVLCEAGMLPGALQRNSDLHFTSRMVDVRIERTRTVCTSDYQQDEVIRIPVAHGEGRYVADRVILDQLEAGQQVVLRYLSLPGTDAPGNPNGSARDIAGICNAQGNVVGFMPHPERLAELDLGSDAGNRFFTSLISNLAGKVAA